MPNFSNALHISKKTSLISLVGFLSNAVCISCKTDSIWAMQEFPGRKPYGEGVKNFFLKK